MILFTTQNVQKVGEAVFHKLTIMLLVSLFPAFAFSQEKSVEKANQAYQYKQYAQAAALYETAIAEKVEGQGSSAATLNLKTKLAYCYRMNNKMDKAERLYEEIVQDDKAKSDTYLYYGETLMCNGKYEEAKTWFQDYLKLEPGDKQAVLLAANCDKIKLIEPYFPYVDIQPFTFNSDADDNAPVAWQNGMVFSSDRKQGLKFMKEKSGWTGRDYLDLYFSAIGDDGNYTEPKRFSSKISEVNKNTGNASFSSDGQEVFFTRNDNELNRSDTYNLQLFSSENKGNGKWKKAEKLTFCSPNTSFMHPAISPDGKYLYFASNKKGEGGVDLWVSKRKNTGWGNPENLGPVVNTSANEGFPFMDENGRLYFCSKGHAGYGGFDIFFTEQDENGDWKTPQNLGQPINSPLDDISIFINVTGKSGMFTSSRGGGDDDIFFFEVLDEAPADGQFAGILPVSNELPEPFINKKPTAVSTETEVVIAEDKEKAEEVSSITKAEIPVEPIETEVDTNGNLDDIVINNPTVPAVLEWDEPVDDMPEETPTVIGAEEEFDPFTDVPIDPEREDSLFVGKVLTAQSSNIFFEMPVEKGETLEHVEQPTAESQELSLVTETVNALFTFQDFIAKAQNRVIPSGQIFRIDGATFDPNIWQLTPKVSKKLNELVAVMKRFPALQIELSAHTESIGPEDLNLELSKNRANMVIEYIIKEGISPDRIKGEGYGETQPLNRCHDGVTCSIEEHLYNQRLEIRVVNGINQ